MTYEEKEEIYHELLSLMEGGESGREQFRQWVHAVEGLCDAYRSVVQLIPACPHHGDTCVSHAQEWVCEQRARQVGIWDTEGDRYGN